MSQGFRNSVKYIYDLPYSERMELCRILDQNDKWEALAGIHMGFDMLTIQALRRCQRPTDELLTKWGHQNHTVLELFVHLSNMQHYQAMLTIKKFVDPEYHRLIYEGEENLSRLFAKKSIQKDTVFPSCSDQMKTSMTTGTNVNLNVTDLSKLTTSSEVCTNESKILNVESKNDQQPSFHGSHAMDHLTMRVLTPSPTPSDPPRGGESSRSKVRSEISVMDAVGPPQIIFKELELATNGWDSNSILGKGGFGTVYKGVWKNTPVAIKRTRNPETDESHSVQMQQILGELRMLNAYRHDNILPLYGYSIGGEDPCLIYQFMPNGSLEDRLLCRQNTPPLSWQQRLTIAVGTARGLQFLHTINEKPLIHGDIKSANILLDSNFQPKIGDFGLAREGPQNQYTHMKVSRVHGTRPYLPDEFLRAKKFSTKVDTHSFGVVLFEIASGLRAYDDQRSHKFLRDLVEQCEDMNILIDKKCEAMEPHTHNEIIKLGKCCVQRRPKDRPEMVLVLRDLEALVAERDILLNAQNMVQGASPIPLNPYEAQLLHDHLSQQRSSTPVSNSTNVECPPLAQADNLTEKNNDRFSARLRNKGIACQLLLERTEDCQVPSIAISPPSVSSQSENCETEDEIDSSSFNTTLPLISALGVKAKTPEETQILESADCDNTKENFGPIPLTVLQRSGSSRVPENCSDANRTKSSNSVNSFSAKDKVLWILNSK